MKKILFLIQLPPPVHGASVVNKSIQSSALINDSFETRYVDISPAKDIADIGKFSLLKFFHTVIIFFRVLVTYFKFKPSLVYLTLSPHGLAFYKDGLLALILKAIGAKMVFHMHGKGIAKEANKSRLKKIMYRSVFKGVDIIHLSDSLFYDVETVRDHTHGLVAVPNSVLEPPDVSVERDGNIVTFIYLSNLVRTKGADILIKATALVPDHLQIKFQVKIVGKSNDKVYTGEVEKIISENKLSNVSLLGPRYGEDKYLELFLSDVFVLPTKFKNECFPLTILEAMSCGLAVISTREGAIPSIVESGVTGEVLEECTPEELASAMMKYIEDPDYMKACGKAGKKKYKTHYTQQVFEENLTSILKELASRA